MDEIFEDGEMTMTITRGSREQPFEEKRRAVLQRQDDPQAQPFSLDAPQTLIGRTKEADLRVNDHFMSGKHARILAVHNFYYIQDLESRNGTTVNGKSITFMRLAHQDLIRVGQTSFRFIQLDAIDGAYIQKLNLQAVQSLALAVEAKDPYTKGHSERVAEISEHIGSILAMPAEQLERLRIAGILHDIGKIGVPESVLLKKEPLAPAEYDLIRKHPVDGANILRPLNFLADIIPAVYHHHERYDGKGYPAGLPGSQTPTWARIIQVADTYDAMTTDRPYRSAFSTVRAAEELRRGSGTQFDPAITKAMLDILAQTR